MEGTKIDTVKYVHFLDLMVSEYFTWKTHPGQVSNGISKTTGILNRLD